MADRYASLKQGLVGCWIPSVSGSGLLLPDLSGRGNNGSLVGMDASDWVSSQYGRALDFDNSNDFITLPSVAYLQNNQPFTLSWWERVTANTNAYPARFRLISATNTFAVIRSTQLVYSTVSFGEWRNALGLRAAGTTLPDSVGQWQHFVIVGLVGPNSSATTDYRVYENANSLTLAASNIFSNFTDRVNQIGWDSLDNGADCLMDDIRIYSRALTESEIKLLASEPGIGFKRISSSAFATRYAYKPAKPRNYSVIRNRDPNYSTLRHGLVAAYCPSISGQGNVLPDLVGGNHGTLTNMSPDDWVSSQYGKALDFDGSNDTVDTNQSGLFNFISTTSQFTITLFGLDRSGNRYSNAIAKNINGASSDGGFELALSQDSTGLDATKGHFTVFMGASVYTGVDFIFPQNEWRHIAIVVNMALSGTARVEAYIDGVSTGTKFSQGFGTAITTNSRSLRIGSDSAGNFVHDGQLDDIRIYSRALTEPEIKLLASKRGIGLEPRKPKITFADLGVQKTYSVVRIKETDYATLRQGLVGAWCPSLPNGGSGNTLADVSGFNNHGTLTNMLPDAWVSSQYGRALRLNRAATKDNVNFGNVCYQPNDFSVSFFVNKIATSANAFGNLWAVSRWNTGASPGTNEFACLLSNGSTGLGDTPTFVIAIGVNEYAIVSSASLRLGFFDHICCVRFADTISIYVNGVNRGTTTGVPTTAITNVSRNLKLGDSDITSDQDNNAMFDDIRIYSRALTEPEIKLLASRPGIGLRQDRDRNTFYQFPSGARRRKILTGMP